MSVRVALLIALALVLAAGTAAGVVIYRLTRPDTYEVERKEYHPPQANPADVLTDDKLDDKTPLDFDAALADRRPLGRGGEWRVNASAAVVRLDVPMLLPDRDAALLTLHPSYKAAAGDSPASRSVLPSVNLLDGKAKQFDDGLYAALDQAYYRGLEGKLLSHVRLVRRLFERVGKDSPAAPFLAAGLELAGERVEVADGAARDKWLQEFRDDETRSKPAGFYTWNEALSACFRFLRFFQYEFSAGQVGVPAAVAKALAEDKALLDDYRKAVGFYARLTNPPGCLSATDLIGLNVADGAAFRKLCVEKKPAHPAVALFPPSAARETVLFEKLFPLGLPPGADLMRELIVRIRSGAVDLRPRPDSGWYDHQVYALETLLLPEKGQERDKLLLTRAYKKRMLEAFQALLTKRRETHVRQLMAAAGKAAAPPPPSEVAPRLRVEPCPTYYLRTARAYSFLANFLDAALGKDALHKLHGLKEGGERPRDLHAELAWTRDLFYGLYLVSAEDIGLKPALAADEVADTQRCYELAADWLPTAFADEDVAADTRVAVPIYIDRGRRVVRAWATLGVRLARLEASYARPPRVKPAKGDGEWEEVPAHRLGKSEYLIPVDEFAEVELPGLRVLTRRELREVCDRERTKEAILQALRK
jgi:hypothetical protein